MKKTLHFLSGLPRSGSTVLAAILNQNPSVAVSTTSGLSHVLDTIATAWSNNPLLDKKDETRELLSRVMRGVIDANYETCDKPIILDKSRTWPLPFIISAMTKVLNRPVKIIATVRSIPDCASSFIRLAKPENLDDFIYSSQLLAHLKDSYVILQSGIQAYPENILLVEYEELLNEPHKQLERIHAFLDLPNFDYDLFNIDGSVVKEDDEAIHGLSGLHDIKSKLKKQHEKDSKEILGRHFIEFCQPEFWKKDSPVRELHPLDLQLKAATIGDFEEGWRIAKELENSDPLNNRAAYNRGWYYLKQGKIQEGYQLMDRGRIEGVFGNPHPDIPTKKWDGKSKGTVLLYLEGGLGDQIHQIRYAKNISEKGCKVIVSCSGQLATLFTTVEGVSAVIQHEAAFGIVHDYWVAGMSAIVPLGLELKDISEKPYIQKPIVIKGKKKCIGLRWLGQTKFEHEHNKAFDAQLMFEAVRNIDAKFISLQRDEGSELCPDWCTKVPLDTWNDSQEAIASCDLVITSCTSVSHLAGAMGIETWVIVPIMPYFLYAMDGEKTPYYGSFTLFRQEVFGDWGAPFEKIKNKLEKGNKLGENNVFT
ncbi:MAG: sulfotransferase [Legionellales bacterium]